MIRRLIQAEFGFHVIEIKSLVAYENLNYIVKTTEEQFIFKAYFIKEGLYELLNAENDILFILHKEKNSNYPKPIPFKDNSFVKKLKINEEELFCRMLSFVEGESLANVVHTESLFTSLAEFIAELDIKLKGFVSMPLVNRKWEWDLQYMNLNKKYLTDVDNIKDRDTLNYVFKLYNENVLPLLPGLRKQVIHNDANEWNVLVKDGRISGIIDFGDLAYSPLINELAITIAYACLGKKNPLYWASIIIRAYHRKLPLYEKEIGVLYYLIIARLTVSICNSAHSRKINPSNKYAAISEKAAVEVLYRWLDMKHEDAEKHFRNIINL